MRHEPEPTRVRQHGRKVTRTTTPEEKIAALRAIVTERSFAKIDGCTVDLFSASAIIAVYDKLNPENQQKFSGLPIPRMATIAFKLLG